MIEIKENKNYMFMQIILPMQCAHRPENYLFYLFHYPIPNFSDLSNNLANGLLLKRPLQ